MASSTDISNLALSHLGDIASVTSIDPPEGSPQAEHCARFYPIALDQCLSAHAWRFATKRILAPAQLAITLPPTWLFAYAEPADALRVLRLVPPAVQPFEAYQYTADAALLGLRGFDDDQEAAFETETLTDGTVVIYSNTENVQIVYIAAITDTAKFTAPFVAALSYLLASYVAGPLTKDPQQKAIMYAGYEAELMKAKYQDSRERKNDTYRNHVAPWMANR